MITLYQVTIFQPLQLCPFLPGAQLLIIQTIVFISQARNCRNIITLEIISVTTRLGLQCQSPVKVKPLRLQVQKASSSEALFSPSKDLSIEVHFGSKEILDLNKNFGFEKILYQKEFCIKKFCIKNFGSKIKLLVTPPLCHKQNFSMLRYCKFQWGSSCSSWSFGPLTP